MRFNFILFCLKFICGEINALPPTTLLIGHGITPHVKLQINISIGHFAIFILLAFDTNGYIIFTDVSHIISI